MLRRTAVAFAVLAAATLLTAAAPKPRASTPEPAPSGLVPPSDDAVVVGSCRVSKATCIDYEGAFPGGEARARCRRAKGTWRDGPCPAEGRIGTCTVRETGTDDRVLTRAYKPASEAAARAECRKAPRAVFMPR